MLNNNQRWPVWVKAGTALVVALIAIGALIWKDAEQGSRLKTQVEMLREEIKSANGAHFSAYEAGKLRELPDRVTRIEATLEGVASDMREVKETVKQIRRRQN